METETHWGVALIPLLVVAASCGDNIGLGSRADDSAVYAAVREVAARAEPRVDRYVVLDSTVAYDSEAGVVPGENAEQVPKRFRKALERVSEVRRPSAQLPLPIEVDLIGMEEAQRTAEESLGGWRFMTLTPVVYSRDGQRAFVYYEVHCGALCGEGAALLLGKVNGEWQVDREELHWVS